MINQKSPEFFKTIGEHKRYFVCRFCFKPILSIISLGYVPLAGAFLTEQELAIEKYYPLDLGFCSFCYLFQTLTVVDSDTLFKNYYYYSSAIKTLVNHFKNVAREIKSLPNNSHKFVVEIGCNDGSFLKESKKLGIKVLGVDPATNIVTKIKDIPIVNDFFTEKLAHTIVKKHGKADMVFSSNTLAHIENMHDVIKGVKYLLKTDGILLFETHYLGSVIGKLQYDMIYHEHQYYYSLLTLQKFFKMHSMEIFDIHPIPIHAGSMRYYLKNTNSKVYKTTKRVLKTAEKERKQKLHDKKTFLSYSRRIDKAKSELMNLLTKLKRKNKTIVGYGASGRATTLSNFCGISSDFLDYVVDDAPFKQGLYTPGTHLKIYPSEKIYEKTSPDYILLFAWSFYDEIIKRHKKFKERGGKFIIPLPRVRII